ncbi:MAG: hypothetical protein CM15mP125_1870 [Gammaproteobacteria bacterium]|nr:MAG: hypothetical protein CM15mP125_1870 [Gammaproteobacteria bacterium]
MGYCIPLFSQFLRGSIHFFPAECREFEVLYDLPVTIGAAAGERVNESGLDAVGSVGNDSHGNPIVGWRTQRPAAHMIHGGVSG